MGFLFTPWPPGIYLIAMLALWGLVIEQYITIRRLKAQIKQTERTAVTEAKDGGAPD